eukprot:gnl/Dysnectes_brevis/1198_a1340_1484.p1 GENE.gnl/Dysnectes_brevis/1198_a1340_1484~~gnl/Dysnectes_brevis/1198_a1340_1484.p1  ORF type:complete len:492 (+),score=157.70 gnl/Dysnectes_brevis/1198_a1340_1484:160-1635(+)
MSASQRRLSLSNFKKPKHGSNSIRYNVRRFDQAFSFLACNTISCWDDFIAYFKAIGVDPAQLKGSALRQLMLSHTAEQSQFVNTILPFIVQSFRKFKAHIETSKSHTLPAINFPNTDLIINTDTICTLFAADFLLALGTSSSVFQVFHRSVDPLMTQKLKFFLSYFDYRRRAADTKLGCSYVVLRRMSTPRVEERVITSIPNTVIAADGIEEHPEAVMADFANRFIGGGAASYGCVQEEILFLLHPELYITMLLAPKPMGDKEAILVSGVTRICRHRGYARTFTYAGPAEETQLVRRIGHYPVRNRHVVAFDAMVLRDPTSARQQIGAHGINREVNKAYAAFQPTKTLLPETRLIGQGPGKAAAHMARLEMPRAIATGNWGCGAFCGNLAIKYLVQLVAASFANMHMVVYSPFGHPAFESPEFLALKQMISELRFTGHAVLSALNAARDTGLVDGMVDPVKLFRLVRLELEKKRLSKNLTDRMMETPRTPQ